MNIFLDIYTELHRHLGGTNHGYCNNYGYRELNNNKNWVELTSGNYGYYYNDNERCYWAIYAPGGSKMKFTITQMKVSI